MKTKTIALALFSVIIVAAFAGVFVFAMEPAVKADITNAVTSDSESTSTLSAVNVTDNGGAGFNGFIGGPMMIGIEPRFGGGHRGFGGFAQGAIQVTSDYKTNVTSIANSDSDVQNLLSQGYNITSIHPVVTRTVDGNGNLVTKASTADVVLQGNNGSRAFLVVDLSQSKVTRIVSIAVTEINK